MRLTDRRAVLGYAASTVPMALGGAALAQIHRHSRAAAFPTNPLGVRALIYTIVTPDLEASIGFYRDLMGFELIGRGALDDRPPAMAAAAAGRPYAFIRTMKPGEEHGILRLLQAPAGAPAIRPHPGSSIMDPGFAVIECMARSVDESYRLLSGAGVKTITSPRYYQYSDLEPLPGAKKEPDFEFRSYSAFGPAGEQLFISSGVSIDHKPWTSGGSLDGAAVGGWRRRGLHDGFVASVLVSLNRWPLWDFYRDAFALGPTRDTFTRQEAINELIGAQSGSTYQFGMMGEGLSMEWWEYRDRPNPETPPLPTSLDRTGHAMTTMLVNDLTGIRARVRGAGIPVIGEGALPMPNRTHPEGFYLRGAVGELIEVVARPV